VAGEDDFPGVVGEDEATACVTVAEFASALMAFIDERGIVISPNWVSRTICASLVCEILPVILSPLDNVIISALAENAPKASANDTVSILSNFISLKQWVFQWI